MNNSLSFSLSLSFSFAASGERKCLNILIRLRDLHSVSFTDVQGRV
jgi:hypothetical protein